MFNQFAKYEDAFRDWRRDGMPGLKPAAYVSGLVRRWPGGRATCPAEAACPRAVTMMSAARDGGQSTRRKASRPMPHRPCGKKTAADAVMRRLRELAARRSPNVASASAFSGRRRRPALRFTGIDLAQISKALRNGYPCSEPNPTSARAARHQ